MKYCQHCGQQLDDDAAFCAKCGCAIEGSNVRTENYAKYDASSGGMWFLGFLLPLVGLICFWLKRTTVRREQTAREPARSLDFCFL